MLFQIVAAVSAGGSKVNLAGEGVSDIVTDPSDAAAGFRFNTDGTIDNRIGSIAVYTQVDALTDWIIPNLHATALYEVRYTGLTGDAFTTEAAAADTWIALSAAREWRIAITAVEARSNSFTFEIRLGSGAVISSATYTVAVEIQAGG